MKVRNHFKTITPEVDIVTANTTIEVIIQIISRNPASRSVFVIDQDERLIGVISTKDVLQILGAKYLRKRTVFVLHEILAITAADIMREAESVGPDDDLEQALRIAVVHNMEDIPVVENNKVIGNLDCFELIKGISAQKRIEQRERYDSSG